MNDAPGDALGRRGLPGRPWKLSEIAWDLGPDRPGAVELLPSVQFLRRARALGVTTFDLGRSRRPAAAELRLGEAFPTPDPEIVTIVPLPYAEPRLPHAGPAVRATPQELRTSLVASRHRLRGAGQLVVELHAGSAGTGSVLDPVVERPALEEDGGILASAIPSATAEPKAADGLRTGTISLLDVGLPRAVGRSAPPNVAWIARDPFAGGRLDGTAFRPSSSATPRPGPPASLRALEAAFEPVRPLGFLTAGTGRTLAQAALRFVLAWPWVITVSVPVPPPERLGEIVGAGTVAPLAEAEIARVLASVPPSRLGEPP